MESTMSRKPVCYGKTVIQRIMDQRNRTCTTDKKEGHDYYTDEPRHEYYTDKSPY
jgi:hypothetical protein